MNNKYELLADQSINMGGHTLFRIKAKISFADVTAGDLGGYIEKEENLAVYGTAWVCGNACVFGNARVSGAARVNGAARIYDSACICDSARICSNACVSGNALVYGNALVSDFVWATGAARIFDNASVLGNVWVDDNACIFGDASVLGTACIFGNAQVSNSAHYMTISPIGSRDACITFMRTRTREIYVCTGCFFGSLAEFRAKIQETHKDNEHAKAYLLAANLAEIRIKLDT